VFPVILDPALQIYRFVGQKLLFFKYGIGFEICIAKTFNGLEKLNIIIINNIIDKMGFLEPIEFAKFVITV